MKPIQDMTPEELEAFVNAEVDKANASKLPIQITINDVPSLRWLAEQLMRYLLPAPSRTEQMLLMISFADRCEEQGVDATVDQIVELNRKHNRVVPVFGPAILKIVYAALCAQADKMKAEMDQESDPSEPPTQE